MIADKDSQIIEHLTALLRASQDTQDEPEAIIPDQLRHSILLLNQAYFEACHRMDRYQKTKSAAVERRNHTTRELSYLVRDVFVMARRKLDRGAHKLSVLETHQIPTGVVRESQRDTAAWLSHAQRILDGDRAHTQKHPTILLDPSREILSAAKAEAETAQREALTAQEKFEAARKEVLEFRHKAQQSLGQARHYIMAAHFQAPPAALREVLQQHGYRSGGRKSSPQEETSPHKKPETSSPSPGPVRKHKSKKKKRR